MTKADLIARLEKEGGSRELDAEIFRALGYHIVSTDRCYPLGVRGYNRFSQEDPQPKTNITTSLDAAIALCERKTETREQFVGVFDKGVDLWLISGDEDHRTMPKYAVLALLRALSTEDGK